MNIKKNILSAALLACTTVSALAQQSTITQQRRAIDEALTTLEDYIAMATIFDDETRYNFIDLFATSTTPVYNDLLGISSSPTIPVDQYAARLARSLRNKSVTISNVRNEGASYDDGKWLIKLSFDKRISYLDSCGVYLSSSEFHDSHDYRLMATIVYDPSRSNCKISGITGKIDSQNKLGINYFGFQYTNDRDNKLYYKGKPLSFNSYDQALLEGSRDAETLKRDFSYGDADVELRPQTDDCLVSMKYKLRRFRLRPHFDMALGMIFNLDGYEKLSDSKSKGLSFGIDLGYTLLSKRSFAISLFTGLGFSQESLDLSFYSYDYNYLSDADVDGDAYQRHYENLKLSQKMKFSALNIPLYFDFNFNLSKAVSLYLDMGARFDIGMSNKIDNTECSVTDVYGIYGNEYDNVRLDGNWGYNGFATNKTYGSNNLANAELIDLNNLTFNALAGIGLRYNFSGIPLSIELGASYLMGLNNLIKTTNLINNSQPLIFNTVDGINSTEHVRNLTQMLNSVNRQQLRVNIGLIYKF
ncbi:MAG: hypothetical protein IKQ05_04965 [Prevotella sp.]|nr:hypothetical protein [Prevotella sp.]